MWKVTSSGVHCGGAQYLGKEAFFVPFTRRFEDQARRIAMCSDYEPAMNGADRLVAMILGM